MASDSDDRTGVASEAAEIVREYSPLGGGEHIRGVSYDGAHVWFATTGRLHALDPASGGVVRGLDVPADAGTAFDARRPARCCRASHHREVGTAATPGWRGPTARCGSASTATGGSIRSIPTPG
jgi:hypothetical protein